MLLAFFFGGVGVGGGGEGRLVEEAILFTIIKFVTLTHIAKCFLWESHYLRRSFEIHYLNQTIALNLIPQLPFCWEKLWSCYIVTRPFTPGHVSVFKLRSKCTGWAVESGEIIMVSVDSCWTNRDRKQISFSRQHQRVHIIVNSMLSPPWPHCQQMIEKMASTIKYCI